jgi:replicative DNA helicase
MCGELVLLGGRPRQGKTAIALRLIMEAMKRGHHGVLFTLEYNGKDVDELFANIGANPKKFDDYFDLDNSDNIDVPYIIKKLNTAPSGTFIVIDYLQLLDQRRKSPVISIQLEVLKSFVRKRGLIAVITSQIDRSYELSGKAFPDLSDVKLPNPLDLSLFNKAYFMSEGAIQMQNSMA